MISGTVYVFIVVLGVTLAYTPGQYIAKSFYIIDQFGHQSDPVFIRSRRDIMDHPLFRVRRGGGGGYASASSHASASSSSGGGGAPGNYGDYIPSFAHPDNIAGQVQNILDNIPGAGGGTGARSFASSSGQGGGSGYSSGQGYGGLGSGHDAGYQGPILFSRFGEAQGTGVHVSGQAQGNKGAFSSSSSSIDDRGKINYSVQSGKY